MNITFLDASTLGKTPLNNISALGKLICYPTSSPSEALERVSDTEVLIINKVKVTAALMDAAPKLKLICEAATGVNNIDLEAAAQRGIEVRNVAGYSTDSVVQLTFCQILSLTCTPERFDREIKDGSYSRGGLFTDVSNPFFELAGKTIGIIGMGNIGSKVARIASSFGMNIIYYSTSGTSHCKEYPSVTLHELLAKADIVSIHCPLNPSTAGLISEAELKLMKTEAILINMARGGIVDETALSEAVGKGIISGAAVDTFTSEPIPQDHPFLHCARPDRLRLTPHVAWASAEALERLVGGITENIKTFYSR